MSETDKGSQDDRYERFGKMTLEEIKEHLAALGETVTGVKKHYEGRLGRLRRELKPDDMDQLMEAFQDLLPMTLNPGVQAEAATGEVPPEELTANRISAMMQDTMLFAARFENSGITAIPMERPGQSLPNPPL